MKIKRESYPDKIRRIAEDLSQMRNIYDVDRSVEKLLMIANELEHNLKKNIAEKSLKLPMERGSGKGGGYILAGTKKQNVMIPDPLTRSRHSQDHDTSYCSHRAS